MPRLFGYWAVHQKRHEAPLVTQVHS
jgi:hypothetical protein